MISPEEIKKKAIRKFQDVLRAYMSGKEIFPLILKANLSLPKTFPELQTALTLLISKSKDRTGYGYAITYSNKNLRAHGNQDIPENIVFENLQDYLKYCKLQSEFSDFQHAFSALQKQTPELIPWAEIHPELLIKYASEWQNMLMVVQWFISEYARHHYYIREIPLPIPTKWIENHKTILREIIDFLKPDLADSTESQFERRYHLKYALPVFRIRKLDEALQLPGRLHDLSTDTESWNLHPVHCQGIIITENVMNYLTLPPKTGYIGIFGKGYAIAQLHEIDWIRTHAHILYWGDLDAHGFYILSELRKNIPPVQSFMMDTQTLEAFSAYALPDPTGGDRADPKYLTPEELSVYEMLKLKRLRVEQERITQTWVRGYWENRAIN
jgi:hypothetical protein